MQMSERPKKTKHMKFELSAILCSVFLRLLPAAFYLKSYLSVRGVLDIFAHFPSVSGTMQASFLKLLFLPTLDLLPVL